MKAPVARRLFFSGAFAARGASILLLVLAWAVAALLLESRRLPPPWTVAGEAYSLFTRGDMAFHVAMTLMRTLASFSLAMLIGAAFGILLGRWRRADVFFDSWLAAGLNVPALVTIILCYVWFGLNEFAAVFAVAVNKIPTVAAILREGARSVDRDLLAVGQAFRLGSLRMLRTVYLPQLYPHLAAAARTGFALTWKIVLVVELLGRPDGVGFQLRRLFNYFDITGVLAYTLVFVAIVMLVERTVFHGVEQHLSRWRVAQ